ncbi:hypothetical protein A4H97_03700 [Niastella yeongjuensis]|uniref:Transglutaminase-like domain-containing protein n=1 Tax=Niastella yeongjuensis TaxID=354355 RepID=A0A1V9EXU0_9BACT|nr:hypothetical protein [Niastella yeongjuensis]OQP50938.1 hypothetical protein A4H97_03700 [Niastella yeongjuensis]SEN10539.1 hypothetical protein SAMN05660816_00199 [Niastella yeongjuensis]
MRKCVTILLLLVTFATRPTASAANTIQFDFCGALISFDFDQSVIPETPVLTDETAITAFYQSVNPADYDPIIKALQAYKDKFKPDDWLYYQLIRKAAQQISPKSSDYHRYTLYKWYLLSRSGYDARLATSGNYILFYIYCQENIYNIPYRMVNGKQFVCLNYHDYDNHIDFQKNLFTLIDLPVTGATGNFSYKITHLPEFNTTDYKVKDLSFEYNENEYHFKVKLNNQIQSLFINYPVVDYALYLNIPLSRDTYTSLIPLLKKSVKRMRVKNGVDYLMRFTRYAFLFEPDTDLYGGEKRLSPEQTLLYDQSDCEDRVALFYCLVKEIYNLPMIVLAYPKHVTIAVQFNKPYGKPIVYNGNKYSICEPSPQKEDLLVGQLLPELKKVPYEVMYVYTPQKK